jgi:phosphate binding protein
MIDTRLASSRAGAPRRSLATITLSALSLLMAAPLHAAPSADPASQPTRAAILTTWHTPEVAGGAVAPTLVLRLLVGTDGSVKQAEVKQKRPGLAAAEKQATDAARTFRFQPALQNGKPVESWITFTVPLKATSRTREVSVKGSDTIGAALMPAWADALHKVQPRSTVHVEALGSSTAFAGLLDGSADVGASSRLINADELAFAEKLGVQLYEIYAGYDGIAVIVHPDNPIRELDMEALGKIFAERVTNWKELGGADAPIHALGRPAYSGTNAFFKERVVGTLGPDVAFGPHVKVIEKTDDIVDAVARDPGAIGYVGLGHVRTGVRALSLKPQGSAVAVVPSAVVIRDGSYPISRPLLLYLRTDSDRDARALVDFALSSEGQALVEKNGFVPLPGSAGAFASEQPAPTVAPPEVIRIYFDPNTPAVSSDSKLDLTQAEMAVRGKRQVLVIGNADSTGKLEDNRRLAKQRADFVASRLREFVNHDASIEVEVAATSHPLATNTTSDGRKANRRVDVIVLKSELAARDPKAPSAPKKAAAESDDVSRR